MATDEAAVHSVVAPAPRTLRCPSASDVAWRRQTVCLVILDAVAVLAGFTLAYALRFELGFPLLDTPTHDVQVYGALLVCAVAIWIGLMRLQHLYDRRYLVSALAQYSGIANASTAGTLFLLLISFFDRDRVVISRGWLVLTWLIPMITVATARFGHQRFLRQLHRRGVLVTSMLIVGANEEGIALAEQFMHDPAAGLRVVGFVDDRAPIGTEVLDGLQVLGNVACLEDITRSTGVREIVVATSAVQRDDLLELYTCIARDDRLQLRLSSGLFEILTTGAQLHEVSAVPLVTPHRVRITGMHALLKTLLDYAASVVMLAVLAPLIVLLAILIKLDSPGPALYRRRVLGVSGKPFDAYKFRTMFQNAEQLLLADQQLLAAFERDYKLKQDPRVTRVGRVLRRTSLDELPQLINVLRGEMSLVGPRMIAPEEAVRYGKWQRNLVTVKPGITGPWQIEGRADLPYEQRVKLSMQYIRNYSLWLDLAILARTVTVVIRGKGAY